MKLDKILIANGHLESADLTAAEKKCLNAYLVEQGATPSFVYIRFFSKGFDEWELEGIDSIEKNFLFMNGLAGERYDGGKFYDHIGTRRGLKVALIDLMADKGMKSNLTTIKRFSADDWKPWERAGMRKLSEGFDAYLEEHLHEYEYNDAKAETS